MADVIKNLPTDKKGLIGAIVVGGLFVAYGAVELAKEGVKAILQC